MLPYNNPLQCEPFMSTTFPFTFRATVRFAADIAEKLHGEFDLAGTPEDWEEFDVTVQAQVQKDGASYEVSDISDVKRNDSLFLPQHFVTAQLFQTLFLACEHHWEGQHDDC